MIRLIYDESVGMSDVAAAKQAQADVVLDKQEYRFGNESYLRAWQTSIASGNTNHQNIVAVFGDSEYTFNEFGVMNDTPDELWFTGRQCAALLRLQSKKRREKRETN